MKQSIVKLQKDSPREKTKEHTSEWQEIEIDVQLYRVLSSFELQLNGVLKM